MKKVKADALHCPKLRECNEKGKKQRSCIDRNRENVVKRVKADALHCPKSRECNEKVKKADALHCPKPRKSSERGKSSPFALPEIEAPCSASIGQIY
jgi:hypothetical protein